MREGGVGWRVESKDAATEKMKKGKVSVEKAESDREALLCTTKGFLALFHGKLQGLVVFS